MFYTLSYRKEGGIRKKTNHSLGSIKVKWNAITETRSRHRANKTYSTKYELKIVEKRIEFSIFVERTTKIKHKMLIGEREQLVDVDVDVVTALSDDLTMYKGSFPLQWQWKIKCTSFLKFQHFTL